VFGSGECIYTQLDGIPSISSLSFPSRSPGGAAGFPGGAAAGSGGGAVVSLRLQRVTECFAALFWHGTQPAV